MNEQEMQTEAAAMVASLIEKGIVNPGAQFQIEANSRPAVLLKGDTEKGFPGTYNMEFICGETARDCCDKANAYIAAIPSHDQRMMNLGMRKLAEYIDFAKKNNFPDKYVEPMRVSHKAMSKNLLTAQ